MERASFLSPAGKSRVLKILFLTLLASTLASIMFFFSKNNSRVEAQAQKNANGPVVSKIFQSPLAGRWYDADKDKLAANVDSYLSKADDPLVDAVHALIVPHAGYQFSGQVAAHAYKQIAGKKFSRVIVMGPSHHLPMENVANVPEADVYSTPLGEISIDVDFVAALKKYPQFRYIRGADENEHSVQIQLPFLQRALGEFKLVPIVCGQLDADTTREMARIIQGLIDPETLVIASSDFTHYGPNYGYVPFSSDILANLGKLDDGAFKCIEKKDAAAFADYVKTTGDTICGRCPIGLLLSMLPEGAVTHKLKYNTSGAITGDTTNSVSYFAIAFSGAWKQGTPVEAKPEAPPILTEEDRAQLLTLARATLEGYVKNGNAPTPEELGIKITPGMNSIMGAFVTLKEHGELRGCIGEIFPRRALYKAVIEHAIDSGVNDHRFQKVAQAELPLLHYEISALTQPHPVNSYNDIVLGKHGIVIEKNGRSAIFLPQVPGEQGWDLPTTLSHLCMKAGLDRGDWKEGAYFTVFEAIVFGEKE